MHLSKQYKFLLLLFVFLIFSLSLSLVAIKTPTKITQKASEPTFPKIEKFNPPPIQHQYQLIAHGFHNFVGELGRSQSPKWDIYTPDFINFVDRKICDISNGLEGEEPQNCNVKNEGGIQVIRLTGSNGLVVKPQSQCNFNPENLPPNLKAKNWETWLDLIEQIKKETGAEVLVNVEFPDTCTEEDAEDQIDINDLTAFNSLVETALDKLSERKLLGTTVKYWSIGNEPGGRKLKQRGIRNNKEYYLISLMAIDAAQKIEKKCPECKIVLSGPGSSTLFNKDKIKGFFETYLKEIKDLNNDQNPFYAVDLHWHRNCLYKDELQYYQIQSVYDWFLGDIFNKIFPSSLPEVWITENSEPVAEAGEIKDTCGVYNQENYNEQYQTEAIIKRILAAFGINSRNYSQGIRRISYSSLIEDIFRNDASSYFSHTGLLDTYGNERLSFKGLEILAEKIYGASKIEWDYNQSNGLETIKIYYDNNQNPETFVLWTRDGRKINIKPSEILGKTNSQYYLLTRIENNQWKKLRTNLQSIQINDSPVFLNKLIDCSSLNISFDSNKEIKEEDNIPTLVVDKNQDQEVNLNITASSSERKLKKLSLRFKNIKKTNCAIEPNYLIASWISPSFVKEISGNLNLKELADKLEEGEYYLFPVVSDDAVGCSGDPSATFNNQFCTARGGKLEKLIKIKIVSSSTTPLPTNTPTPIPTPINTPTPQVSCSLPSSPSLKYPENDSVFSLGSYVTLEAEPILYNNQICGPGEIQYQINFISPKGRLFVGPWSTKPTWKTGPYNNEGKTEWWAKARLVKDNKVVEISGESKHQYFYITSPTYTPTPTTPTAGCPNSCPQLNYFLVKKENSECLIEFSWDPVENAQSYKILKRSNSGETDFVTTLQTNYLWKPLPCKDLSWYQIIPLSPGCQEIECQEIPIQTLF